jgi:hypothetical protein
MRQFMRELGYDVSEPSLLRMDNQSAIAVSKNPEHHGRMRLLQYLQVYCVRASLQRLFPCLETLSYFRYP